MRKVNVKVRGRVLIPVRVNLDVLIRADDDAKLEFVLKQLAKGIYRTAKADVEEVEVETAEFDGLLDPDENLVAQVQEWFESDAGGSKFEVITSEVTDSR